jgi:hypothetical protein
VKAERHRWASRNLRNSFSKSYTASQNYISEPPPIRAKDPQISALAVKASERELPVRSFVLELGTQTVQRTRGQGTRARAAMRPKFRA